MSTSKMVNDVAAFHRKFGIDYYGPPRQLERVLEEFRVRFMQEELTEYISATYEQDIEDQLDALVDLVYVALGTAHLQGFDFARAWKRVHAANMKKVRDGEWPSKCVKKPEGWEPPNHHDLTTWSSVVILEGADGSGKSRLAERLSEMYSVPTVHETSPEAQKKSLPDCLVDFQNINGPVILDRCVPVSEFIYKRMIDNKETIELNDLIRLCDQKLFILCCPEELDHVPDTHESHAYVKKIADSGHAIQGYYKAVFNILESNGVKCIHYDYKNEDDFRKVKEALDEIFD